jgi:hypothetical protein
MIEFNVTRDRAPRLQPLPRFASTDLRKGIREYCTQCGEMIFADKTACVVSLPASGKWLTLYFHHTCYFTWEQGG